MEEDEEVNSECCAICVFFNPGMDPDNGKTYSPWKIDIGECTKSGIEGDYQKVPPDWWCGDWKFGAYEEKRKAI